MGEMGNAYKILVGKPERKVIWETRRRGVDNIKMDLKEVRCEDRVQWRYFLTTWWTFGFLKRRGISSSAEPLSACQK